MRFLIVNADYAEFLDEFYESEPLLRGASFEAQMQRRTETLFSLADFYSFNLAQLGHEAREVHVNNRFAQSAWAREHAPDFEPRAAVARSAAQGLRTHLARTPLRRLARLARPMLESLDRPADWVYDVLRAQVTHDAPDVVLVQAMDILDPSRVRDLVPAGTLLVGQTTAFPTGDLAPAHYDLVLSSLPSVVARYRAAGFRAELHLLGFEPRVNDIVGRHERDIPISFVGSLQPVHAERVELLEELAARLPELEIWASDAGRLPARSLIRRRNRGSVWGRQMYEVLARSTITLNHHDGAPAAAHANNLRLYEATGMGALLVTDWKQNLGELFDTEHEVVAYRSPGDAYDQIQRYRDNPDEAVMIAAAGQARTLRDHTYRRRMESLVEIVRVARA